MQEITILLRGAIPGIILLLALLGSGCDNSPTHIATTPIPTPSPSPTPLIKIDALPITLPLLDALLQLDETFPQDVKQRLQLTDEQIAQLGAMARDETGKLRENGTEQSQGSTTDAGELARKKIAEIIGEEKVQQLSDLALEHWGSGQGDVAQERLPGVSGSPVPLTSPPLPTPSASPAASASPVATASPRSSIGSSTVAYNMPTDTRVVINAPAHQMDVFENGQLVKSYKVGIGYPEFPVPYGERKAGSIIFNPSWTPPDEPWVETSKNLKIGQRVPAGDKLNPLGILKIPVGLPSLIHGGKKPSQIGGFASHGCVGLTNQQVQDFAKHLAHMAGVELTDEQIAKYRKTPSETKAVKLGQPIPIEFRYDTIVVSDGKLHIYRDVYDRDTNTETNLRVVLGAYGMALEDLTEEERQKALEALELMGRPPNDKAGDTNLSEVEKKARRQRNIEKQRLTKGIKGEKEIVIEIAALAGKGYPAPVDLDAGLPQSTKDKSPIVIGKAAPERKKIR